MKQVHRKIILLLVIVVFIGLYYYTSHTELVKQYSENPGALRQLIKSFGLLAPLIIIILQMFQTTVSIIPSQITTIVAGFIFGPILGMVYSLIGAVLGSALIFYLARKYETKVALRFFDKTELAHFDAFFKQRKKWAMFLARLAPIFPNDLVSMAAGLTKIKFRTFNIYSTIGFVIQMLILTYFGSELAAGKLSLPLILITIVVSLLIIVVLFKNKIKKWIIKDFHKIEQEFKK